MYGREKWILEPNRLKRAAYWLLGEVHVPGRLRSYHLLRAIRRLGLMDRRIRMLDAGSGRGDLAIHLAQRCPQWTIRGIDLSEEKVKNANLVAERLGLKNVEFQVGSLTDNLPKGEFDLVVNADVLEHISDDVTVIRNLCDALREGGHLLITSPSVPQRKHLALVHWRERRIGFQPSDYGHVRDGYSKEDISHKLRAAGAEIVSCDYTFGRFGTLAFDLFFALGDSQPNPLVFAASFPVLMTLSACDLKWCSGQGSAILAVAQKGD